MPTHATIGRFDLYEDLARGRPAPHLLERRVYRGPRLYRKAPRYSRPSLAEAIRGGPDPVDVKRFVAAIRRDGPSGRAEQDAATVARSIRGEQPAAGVAELLESIRG
jgi:hypothetical protein